MQTSPKCLSANGFVFLEIFRHIGGQIHDCTLVSTRGSDLIQSSVVMCYLNAGLHSQESDHVLQIMQFVIFSLLVFLCWFKNSPTKLTKRDMKKGVPEAAGECM